MRLVKPIYKECAAYVEDEKALIIADLHIGIEYEFYEQGIYVGSKVDVLANRVANLLSRTNAEELVILGDLKHVVPTSPPSQRKDISRFFQILGPIEVILVPGNHDGGIRKVVPENVKVELSTGLVIKEGILGLVHGHSWPSKKVMECSTVIAAHTHPVVELKDPLGHSYFERCWVFSKVDAEKLEERYNLREEVELIVMPAFNPLCGGIAVNKEGIAEPLSKIVDPESIEIYLLDGTCLGKTRNFKTR